MRILLPMVLFAALGCGSSPPRAPVEPFDVQGHRGARGLLPENTLPAFELALELGVSTLELDTGVTADGVVVVSHDPRLSAKVCLGPDGAPLPADGGPLIRDLTLVELRRYDCGALNPDRDRFPEPPRNNLPGTPIPTLDQVFDLAAERDPAVRFNIEVKFDPTADLTVPLERFVERVVERVVERGVVERTTIQSFDWRALALVKRARPEIRTAALLSPETLHGNGGAASPWLDGRSLDRAGGIVALLDDARDVADVFSPHWRQILPGAWGYLGSTVAEVQTAGFAVVPWTVNRPAYMEKILDLGVDGIITDYPDRLLELLERRRIAVL